MNVNAILDEQDGVITRKQALGAGMSRSAISRKVTSEEWSREAPCIYRSRATPWTPLTGLRVAVYSAGEDAVVCGPSAAWCYGLTPEPGQHWVNIPVRRALEFRNGRRVRRRELRPQDIAAWRGLTITSVPLTVLDTALLPDRGDVLVRALQHRRVTVPELLDCHRRNSQQANAAQVGAMLAQVVHDARSEVVRSFTAILRHAGISGWATQVRTLGFVVDVAFIAERIAVDLEGWAGSPSRRRQSALVTGGWRVLHFSWRDLDEAPGRVVTELRAALARAA